MGNRVVRTPYLNCTLSNLYFFIMFSAEKHEKHCFRAWRAPKCAPNSQEREIQPRHHSVLMITHICSWPERKISEKTLSRVEIIGNYGSTTISRKITREIKGNPLVSVVIGNSTISVIFSPKRIKSWRNTTTIPFLSKTNAVPKSKMLAKSFVT